MRHQRSRLASVLTVVCTAVVATGVAILASSAPAQAAVSNLATFHPATADSSCSANEGPAKAVNGSVTGGNSDKWCSTGATKFLQVDLGAAFNVNRFIVRHASAGGETADWNTKAFTIQLSSNGTQWSSPVVSYTTNALGTTDNSITATSARYVKLNITVPTQTSNNAARIYELEVYGSGLPAPVACPGCWDPWKATTWNWVLSKDVSLTPYENVQVYDIDGFDRTAADVTALHNAGRKVICYISAGSWEDWRSDAAQFPPAILGNPLDPPWTNEKWLDIRNVQQPGSALAQIMNARLDMCDSKGFDAVEFDNQDGYANTTGFPLTADDQLTYNAWLANAARARGMSAVLKNDVDQIGQLTPYYDLAINEECHTYEECGVYTSFINAGKPVLNAEYDMAPAGFCSAANEANINAVRFPLLLDGSSFDPCRSNVSLFHTATADSSCGANEGPAKAVNGSTSGGNSDKWCSNGTNKFLQVDFGSTFSVKQFIIRHAGAGGESASLNTRSFNIHLSTDGTNWTTAVPTITSNTVEHTYHSITPTNARYVKLNVLVGAQPGSGSTAARIYDFEVYTA